MIEVELKSVVDDIDQRRARLEAAGAVLSFAGRLEDRRYDHDDRSLMQRDHVLRTRAYRDARGDGVRAELGWKGPTEYVDGYKQREEIGVETGDARTLIAILKRLGLRETRTIEREIRQYRLDGAIVRMEHYPEMDDLVEVEGEPADIERAIAQMGIPREAFSSESLAYFVSRYEERTGRTAITGAVTHA